MNQNVVNVLTGFVPQVLPEVVLGLGACVLFLGATFKVSRHVWGSVALILLALAGGALVWTCANVPTLEALRSLPDSDAAAQAKALAQLEASAYAAPVVFTHLAIFFKVVALLTGVLLVLLGWNEAGDDHAGEYHACLLLISAAIGLVGSANDLITIYLALELISIPTYVLLYLPRVTARSQEAAMKYFLLSIFSSGLLLLGFSYLYGLSGTTNIPALLEALAGPSADPARSGWLGVALLAVVMVVAGLGFRIAAVPFHFYAPDVYQGTTTPSAALLAFVPKVVGFAALLRVLGYVRLPVGLDDASGRLLSEQAPMLLWIMAAVTMTLGNILALLQDNLKRILAYSSVANAGYMLITLAVLPYTTGATGRGAINSTGGLEALLFYLIAYGAMTIGLFAVLHHLTSKQRPLETVDDLAGLSRTHPGMALVLVLFLFSLVGIPLTGGFVGKFLIFFDAFTASDGSLVQATGLFRLTLTGPMLCRLLGLIGAINAAIAAYYYLRLAMAMYLREAIEPLPRPRPSPTLGVIATCALLTVVLGVYPMGMIQLLRRALPSRGEPQLPRVALVPRPAQDVAGQ